MIKIFHIFIVNFLLLSSSPTINARVLDSETLKKILYELEPQVNKNNILVILKRSLENPQCPGELAGKICRKETGPISNTGALKKPFASIFQNFQKYPVPGSNTVAVEADSTQNQIGSSQYLDKLFSKPETDWIANIKGVSPVKRRRSICRKIKKRRFYTKFPGSGKIKRYLDYTNSQMPFNEGQKLQQQNKAKTVKFSDEASQDDKSCMNNIEDLSDLKLKHKLEKRRSALPLRSKERNFEILQDDSDSEYSRVRRYLDHKRVKKRISMTSTLEAKEAAMSRVLDPNLNLDGILEPHVRKRRGKI